MSMQKHTHAGTDPDLQIGLFIHSFLHSFIYSLTCSFFHIVFCSSRPIMPRST